MLPETSKIAEGITRAFREVDPKAAEAGRRWGQEIQRGLGDARVELKADTAKAKAEIDEASRKRDAKIQAEADTAKAEAKIDVAARDRKAHITVDSDALVSSVSRSMSQASPAMAGVGAQLGSSLASAGAKAGPEVAGSLSSAMGPVGGALTAVLVGGAAAAVGGIAAALSGVVGLIPAGLAGAGSVIGTLALGLDGVKDAWDAAGKAADSATKDQEEKAKSVASAQKSLRDAVLEEATAQKDVANARKDARQQLEDLNVQLRGGVIDEKSAILDAQAARRDLATGRFKDSIEYQQAQLRVQQADQRVLEAHQRNVELQNKSSDANAKGVNQADQVVAANQRLAKTHEDVAAAQKNLSDAQGKHSSTADAFATAMGKLSPNAQAFINTLQGLKPVWESLKFSVQDSLFAGIGPELQRLATQYMPVLKEAMSGLAGTMNTAFKDIGAWLSNPAVMGQIKEIVANIGTSFEAWSRALVPFSQAFLTVTQVGSGFLPQLGRVITEGANAFNNFIQQAAKSGQLQEWMRTGIEAMGELIKMFPLLARWFIDLAPIGIPVLQTINMLLRNLEPAVRVLGAAMGASQTGLNLFWQAMGKLVDVSKPLVPVLSPVAGVLHTMGGAFDAIVEKVKAAWHAISDFLSPVKALLDAAGIHIDMPSLSGPGGAPGSPGSIPTASQLRAGTAPGGALPTLSSLRAGGAAAGGGARPWLLNDPNAPSAVPTPSATAATPSGFNWDAVAQAESSGNWANADTGHNGHYGGLQFSPDTWKAFGGLEFAPRADQATPDQQKIVADRTAFTGYKGTPPQGLGAWETITNGSVPGITTSSQPSPGGGAVPSLPTSAVPSASPSAPSILHDEGGLHSQAAAVNAASIIAQLFPSITNIGGAHPDSMPYHPEGRALDIMIPGGSTMGGANPQGKALGDQIKAFFLQNAAGLGVEDTIWQDFWQPPGGQGNSLGRASQGPTQGHFDHVHVTFSKGATPTAGLPNVGGMYPSAAGMPTIASPGGVSPEGLPQGTQNSPYYVAPTTKDSPAKQLGQDFLGGLGEIFGLDGTIMKSPLDWPVFKGITGVLKLLSGSGKGGGGGLPGSAFQAAGAGLPGGEVPDPAAFGGGGGGGLGGLLSGILPQPFGPDTVGGPAAAPDVYNPLIPGSGGKTAVPASPAAAGLGGGNQQDNRIIFNGPVGNPQAAGDMANHVNIPRARLGVQAIPGMN